MKCDVLDDAAALAAAAAARIAFAARRATAERGRFTVAFSGGTTPGLVFDALVDEQVPWSSVHLFQVDERVAPDGHRDRNATELRARLLDAVPIPAQNVHLMGVTAADLPAATVAYEHELRTVCGPSAVLDLIHLGLGDDGHTASLAPGDAVLDVTDRDVALTAHPFNGRTRMTLTYRTLDRSRSLLWLVSGATKAAMLRRLVAADHTIPAGRVAQDHAELLADREAWPNPA